MTEKEREKAIAALKISVPIMAMTHEEFNDYIQTLNKIMDLLEQEHRKGHWVESDYGNMITQHRWYCSECGGMHNDSESGEWREVFDFKYDYCPLCGADMREVEE